MEEDLFGQMTEFLDETPDNVNEVEESNELEETQDTLVEESETPEVVDEEEPDNIEGQEGSNANDDTSSLLFSFASTLVEDGVLPSLDLKEAKIKSTEDLINAIKTEIKKNEFADLTPLQKEAIEAFRSGIPAETFWQRKSEGEKLNQITKDTLENNLELRKDLIKRDFLSKGYSEDKAEKFVQRSIDLGEDIDDAIDALEGQKKLLEMQTQREIAEAKQREEDMLKQHKEQLKQLENMVYDETKEVIPGIHFNKMLADEVYNSMTKIVDEVQGQPVNKLMKDRLENPIEFEFKLHYLYNLTKGFKDFSKLNRVAKTKAVKDFEEKLKLNNGGNQSPSRGKEPDFDFLERHLG